MEENVNEILGVSNESEANTEVRTEFKQQEKAINNEAENMLSIIANAILIVGLLSTLICAFTICFITGVKPGYTYVKETVFNPTGFATTITILFSTLISWSVMKVIANISLTLKDINKKLDK